MTQRQEKEPARSEVSEVAPGVLRLELPIRLPGLGHVNCYAILDREGAAIVDPGLPGASTWRALQDRLKRAGLAPRHVHSVFVTHSHPDHFGGAARFARESGARILAHRSFRFGVAGPADSHSEVSVQDLAATEGDAAEGAPDEGVRSESDLVRFATQPTPWGGERPRPPFWTRMRWTLMRWIGERIVPQISQPVEHGDVLRLADREWFVLHTPGHTGDHVCLHDPDSGIFLSGDHVLPTITPHISGLASSADPLASYFYSLDRVAEIPDVRRVLPAHGHPFHDLAGRAEAIKRHHAERLDAIASISAGLRRAASVEEFSHQLFRPRSWGAMADSETYAHLEHLRIAGRAERRQAADGSFLYEVG